MFKSARWRGEKNRIKAVFKLQFHVTQVLQPAVDALTLSIIPGYVGKPTTRLEKTTVRDGSCRWENPIYETVKFIQDPKTGKINERIYYFAVSTGLSKAGFFKEVSIDFADYAEATKSSSVSFPLKSSHCDAVLHVQIERIHENTDKREVEEYEDVKIKSHDRSLKSLLSNGIGDTDESAENNSTEDASTKGIAQRVQLTANCRSSSGSDITLSSSESSSGLTTPRELGVKNATIHQDPAGADSSLSHPSEPHKPVANASTPVNEEHLRSHWGCSADSDHGLSTDDSTNSSHDALQRQRSQQSSDIEIDKLKAELAVLARQVDLSDLELQTLRKQIIKESKRGQDLSKEIIALKEEKDAFKMECKKLKSFQKCMDEAKSRDKSQLESEDLRTLVVEIRQELNYEKDLNANLRLQLQKTQESNAELILAVQDLDEMLGQKNREISNLANKSESCKSSQELSGKISKCESDDDEEQKALEELVKEHSNAKGTHYLERKIGDLHSEIEIYRRDKDELEMQMEQLALDYEILKQENHDITYQLEQSQLQEQMQYECSSPAAAVNDLESHIESLEHELKKQSKEFSDSLSTIKELETHIKSLEEEMEKQAQGFEADLDALTRAKVEQEQRAILAEEALRKSRLKNVSTAEKLQEEFRRLSVQMASTFDANEKVAMKALTEASELHSQKNQLEEMLQDVREELQSVKEGYGAKLLELSNQIDTKTHQIEQTLLEIESRSKQIEHLDKCQEEISLNFSKEIEVLKAENERLTADITCPSEHAEQKENLRADLELMKKSINESELLIQRGKIERNELVSTIAIVKKETDKLVEEVNRMKHLKDEKDAMVRSLQSELETIKAQCTDMKHSLFDDEVEKEKLRKQAIQLKSELKKKDEIITNIEKKFKDSNGRAELSDGNSTTPKNQKSAPLAHNLKEVATLRERIKNLEGQIKLKEAALETSTNSFLEKEKDLHNKIEELESRAEEFIQSSALQKVADDSSFITSNGSRSAEVRNTVEYLNGTKCGFGENGDAMSSIKSDEILPEKEPKTSMIDTSDDGLGDLLTELASLKEGKKIMESELKDMQQRYSEISLKFAEVEGERQKLVMTVRYLKNTKKS
ncbi:putative Myosin heavy chain-related protein [Quillaja saponaria]|uniref:Myosin heavy chain-related protein n=1 Tax=Quillaja saponaria TaxID=32244 RepID=A0AAD7L696_QUISA|nr:putative Myosin heavy chain-related protein [Quillaja saponaria]